MGIIYRKTGFRIPTQQETSERADMGLSNVYRWVSRRLKHQSSPESPESVRKPRHHIFSLRKLKRVFRRGFTRNNGHNPHHDCSAINENSSATPTSNHDQNHELLFRHRSLSFHDFSSPLLSLISQKLQSNDDYNNSDTPTTPHISLSPNVTTSPDIIPSRFSLPVSDASHRYNPSHEHAKTTADLAATTNNHYDQSNDLHLRTTTPSHDIDSSSPQASLEHNNSDVPATIHLSSSPTSNNPAYLQSSSPPSPATISVTAQLTSPIMRLPTELLQLIFRFCFSNKPTFDFSMQIQYKICSVSPYWRDVAVGDTRHFWDLAVYDCNQTTPLQKWLFQVSNRRNTVPPNAKFNRVSLDLPASARQTQLNELRQFVSDHLHHCDHIQIRIPLYNEHSGLNLPESLNSNHDEVFHARATLSNVMLFDIMDQLNLSRSLNEFSWSSQNPLVDSLSSFLSSGRTYKKTPQTDIDRNAQSDPNNLATSSSQNSEPPLSPAERWPNLSHLRVNSRIRFQECVSIFKEFLSLESATLGPISLASHTEEHLIHPTPPMGTLQSLTLTFLTMFDAHVALHGLFGANGCLRQQPVDSLTIICQNHNFSTASDISDIHGQERIINSDLSFELPRQLNSLELVDVPFKDGVDLLQRWRYTTVRDLKWRNNNLDVPQQSMLMGISEVDDENPFLPILRDLQMLSLSFLHVDKELDGQRSWKRTSALLSQIRNPAQTAPLPLNIPADLSLVLSHRPKSFRSLFRLPLAALKISEPISTADCLTILSGCPQLQHLAVVIDRSKHWREARTVDCAALQSLHLTINNCDAAARLFVHIRPPELSGRLVIVLNWDSTIDQRNRNAIRRKLHRTGFRIRSEPSSSF
ncbi:hypothetical protein CVT24_013146 [Panaeolus cyanescens]|uniref:F-box domain-containing protein n=1 Tax=Panaeolus cyanescens TaxID=181874 RepID=A0A409WR10_9AGAR|nr:hypothetical protein CVT24_013146 [Panaeolus cyanescens]